MMANAYYKLIKDYVRKQEKQRKQDEVKKPANAAK